MQSDNGKSDRLRLDKWLWAARFFKTRALAAEAVESGKVLCHGQRVKPARALAVGDLLSIRLGPYTFDVVVRALSARRGPAPKARQLYAETEESQQRRAALAETLRTQGAQTVQKGRPTKRDRRAMERFKRRAAWSLDG